MTLLRRIVALLLPTVGKSRICLEKNSATKLTPA